MERARELAGKSRLLLQIRYSLRPASPAPLFQASATKLGSSQAWKLCSRNPRLK